MLRFDFLAIEALLDKALFLQEREWHHGREKLMFLITDAQGIEALKYLAIGMRGCSTAGRLGIKGKTVHCHKHAKHKPCVKSDQELYRWMELRDSSHLVGPTLI